MNKTIMFQVRVTPADYERIAACAAEEYLSVSAWARRAVLLALERAEHAPPRAQPTPPPNRPPKSEK
jgi:hypothetical protein